ncbi:MAG: trimethylamine methyltransferase family protein [Hyphomicrobiaceae bacterium]
MVEAVNLARRGRKGRERRSAEAGVGGAVPQRPWGPLRNPYPKAELLAPDQVEAIHAAAVHILEDIGVRFLYDPAIEVFAKAGALIDRSTRNVRIGRELIDQATASAPQYVTLTPRNADRSVRFGGDSLVTTTVLGPPFCTDIDRGRRPGNLADFSDFVRLGQYFNIIHMISGSPVEAQDVPVPVRHLEQTLTTLKLADKVPYVFCHSRQRIHDVLDMIAMARGEPREALIERPGTFSIINTNSPLQYDSPMAMGVMELAFYNQPSIITPFSLAGATMPVTLAGSLAMSTAEMLAGLVLAQLVRPGAPVVSGAKVTNVDLKTGAPAFGSPEFCKTIQMGGQMARRYGIPYRASNFNSSTAADAQAAYESEASIWASITGGANVLFHAAGWLEGGLCSSFEKFALDVEMLQWFAAYLEPMEISEETLAFEEIRSVPPGGHYFGTEHTIAAYKHAFHSPLISSTKNFGQWVEDGAKDATRRAQELYKHALADYQPPPMDPAISDQLEAFVAKRKEEGGAPLD